MTLGRSGSFALGGLLTGFSDDKTNSQWVLICGGINILAGLALTTRIRQSGVDVN